MISLEITGTELAKRVRPPQFVRDIDWVDNFWRPGSVGKNGNQEVLNGDVKPEMAGSASGQGGDKGKMKAEWPKVQLYCLVSNLTWVYLWSSDEQMGMRGAWTDWHVDFAASSVYYTVHTGAKVSIAPHNQPWLTGSRRSSSSDRPRETSLLTPSVNGI